MPAEPKPYSLRDWRQVTRDYLDLVSEPERHGQYLPLMRWPETQGKTPWMPAYVGTDDGAESINYLAAVVSGSLVGLDMRTYRGRDWVAMGTNFFNPLDGIFLDWPAGESGGSFWYDVLPNVLFYQVGALYPSDRNCDGLMRTVAERWHEACLALGGSVEPPRLPNYDHTGFKLRTMQPFDNGQRIEPEGAAGIAWLEYMAWRQFKDPRFLTTADWSVRALEQRPYQANPLYEVLLPYGAFIAARMQAELGTNYNVFKLVNWCFEARPAPQARPNWGVITGSWNGLDVHGLVGSVTDGGGYAFAMNSFQYAGALAPLARYDASYARDIGKWLLNLANAARLFYPNAHPPARQSSYAWSAANDLKGVIAYEGLRKWRRGSSIARDFESRAGETEQGTCVDTKYYREKPIREQVLKESRVGDSFQLEHIWEFVLPKSEERFLVVVAQREDGGHNNNAFVFSYANNPEGPYTRAFEVQGKDRPHVVELSPELKGKLYLKVASADASSGQLAPDRLRVDAMAISHRSDTCPYAQGDQVVAFIDLLKDSTVPIVLYRPDTAVTDLGLYGSSHVGILGGLIRPTNIEKILLIDLLKTDYFHAPAFPTYLAYNPYPTGRKIKLTVGDKPCDIYDCVSKSFLVRQARQSVRISIPADSARVLVLAPAGGRMTREGLHTLINDVVVDFNNGNPYAERGQFDMFLLGSSGAKTAN
jgi:hypothetical protein